MKNNESYWKCILLQEKVERLQKIIKRLRNRNRWLEQLRERAKKAGVDLYKYKQGDSYYIRRRDRDQGDEKLLRLMEHAKDKNLQKFFIDVFMRENDYQ